MKTIRVFILLLFVPSFMYAQGVKFGGAFTYGFGGIKNEGQVQNYFNALMAQDPTIVNYTFTNKSGSFVGLRFDLDFYTSQNFSFNTGLQYFSQSNDFIIDYKQMTNGSNGSYDLIHSTAVAKVQSVSIPFIVKYAFGQGKVRPFLNGGVDVEFRFSKNLSVSSENFTHWDGGAQAFSYQTGTTDNKPLDGYSMIGANFSIGAGVDYKMNEHILYFSVNYRMALLSGTFSVNDIYGGTSSGGFSGEVNKVFNADKQKDALSNYGININDWKSSGVMLTLGFLF